MPNKSPVYDKEFRQRFEQQHGVTYSHFLRKRSPERYILNKAKSRAKSRGLEFALTLDDIKIPEYCPALGIKLEINQGRGFTANSPSLDRIDNEKGYLPDNVQIISQLANVMKNSASHRQLKKFAYWILRTSQCNHLTEEQIMTIENQVASLVAGQTAQNTALAAISTQLTALQTAVAAIPTTPVAPLPATTSPPDILAAVATLQTGVNTLLADVTDPSDTQTPTPATAAPAA